MNAQTHKEDDHAHDQGHGHGHGHGHGRITRAEIARLIFVAGTAGLLWMAGDSDAVVFHVFGVFAAVVGGYPIYRHALADILRRRMTMELSMTIALVAALLIGEFFTTIVIIFFVLLAEVLENLTVDRGRMAIGSLLSLLPNQVTIRMNGGMAEVSADQLAPGTIVVIRPGSRIPVDGVVIAGDSYVDQSAITGESLPVEKTAGGSVFAGTFNQSGVLEIRTNKVGRDTAFGRIIETVERAEQARAPIQKIADRLAGYLVYFAIGCALITYYFTHDVRATISVIIVAGACGVAAGTPLAILGAIGSAAREGIIIKGGIPLQTLAGVNTVVLDKTGTLTSGRPEVIAIHAAPGARERDVLLAAALAERKSEHALGRAVITRADREGIPADEPDRFQYLPGRGIICSVGQEEIVVGNKSFLKSRGIAVESHIVPSDAASEILVARGGRFLGSILLADAVRPEAARAMRDLHELRIRTCILSGDSASITAQIAKELGISENEAELLPDEKLARIDSLRSSRHTVAMIGDGINDAPALTRAHVGVAMGSGTDVARECADIVLIGNDLGKFVEAIRIARRCMAIIRVNFAGTILVDSVGLVLASTGHLSPLFAAIIHVTSELAFILNSARLVQRG